MSSPPRTGTQPFHVAGQPVGFDVASFWRWSASDLTGNLWRGVLAEYLVAKALGVASGVRAEWDACDIRADGGLRVEVKSAAYLQSWAQRTPSTIGFDIALKRGWDAATNSYAPAPCRTADFYVFALLAHRNKATLDPVDLAQWEFYVVLSSALNRAFPSQKRIALSSLKRLAPTAVTFAELAATVAAAIKAPDA